MARGRRSRSPADSARPIDDDKLRELDAKGWELYNVNEDPAETKNLAEKERARLIEMIGMWYVEAGKYNVLPIDSRGTLRFAEERPQIAVGPQAVHLLSGTQSVPSNAAPRLVNVPHSVSVHANVPKGGAEGVLFSMGGVDGGFAFYVQGGKLTYGYNYVADQRFKVQSDRSIPEGDHIFSFEFKPTGKADIAKGKGVPATSSCSLMARRWARRSAGDDTAIARLVGGRLRRRRFGLAGHDRLQATVRLRRDGEESAGGRDRQGGRRHGGENEDVSRPPVTRVGRWADALRPLSGGLRSF